MFNQYWSYFITNLQAATPLEIFAVLTGVICVWLTRKENVLTYPIGLINTIAYVYISAKHHLFGEAAVNMYYTVMNIYGWWLWTRRNSRNEVAIQIEFSSPRLIRNQLVFFVSIYGLSFLVLDQLKNYFGDGVIPWADGLASATAFTGMWLQTRKKVESWYWWIATNIVSIPLYFSKLLVLTSVYYAILLVLAFAGLITWWRRARTKG